MKYLSFTYSYTLTPALAVQNHLALRRHLLAQSWYVQAETYDNPKAMATVTWRRLVPDDYPLLELASLGGVFESVYGPFPYSSCSIQGDNLLFPLRP